MSVFTHMYCVCVRGMVPRGRYWAHRHRWMAHKGKSLPWGRIYRTSL